MKYLSRTLKIDDNALNVVVSSFESYFDKSDRTRMENFLCGSVDPGWSQVADYLCFVVPHTEFRDEYGKLVVDSMTSG